MLPHYTEWSGARTQSSGALKLDAGEQMLKSHATDCTDILITVCS